ncbi:hypothetical protein GcM3_181016 [Golovinomyces cichoracearum]|uniref:Uncharacterized protein n=1 Tax=Golovinomyces cichoracearum TaxID=62708 RepID=A0A420HMB2_9PEZI|nr:hypothetical protein GcM3_181016 [Golovinomyces cichoracearum]
MVLHENLESNSSASSYLPSASARFLKILDSSDLTETLLSMRLNRHLGASNTHTSKSNRGKLIQKPKQPWDNPHASEKKA